MCKCWDYITEFLDRIVESVYNDLSEKDKAYMIKHPVPSTYHFSLGLTIRNKYIYLSEDYPEGAKDSIFADEISGWVIAQVILKLYNNTE